MMDAATWWTAFGAIAQAIGALATFLAVAVTLWLTRTERSLRATGRVGFQVTFVGDGSPGVYHVGFTVLNTGLQPIQVMSVGWRTGWCRFGPKWLQHRWAIETWEGQTGVATPYELAPRRSAVTIKQAAHFVEMRPDVRADLFRRPVRLLGNAPIRGVVNITGRPPLIVKVTKDLAGFLRGGDHPLTTG